MNKWTASHAIFCLRSHVCPYAKSISHLTPILSTIATCSLQPSYIFRFRWDFPQCFNAFRFPLEINPIPLPSDTSCTRSTFRKSRALSLHTFSHLNLVCLPLQVFLIPALHSVHLRSPALSRTCQDLALTISSAIRDSDRFSVGVGMSLGICEVV
jgi:hypothetical protein